MSADISTLSFSFGLLASLNSLAQGARGNQIGGASIAGLRTVPRLMLSGWTLEPESVLAQPSFMHLAANCSLQDKPMVSFGYCKFHTKG